MGNIYAKRKISGKHVHELRALLLLEQIFGVSGASKGIIL